MQSTEKENTELNEKYNEIMKKYDDYVTKIASMEEKIDLLERKNHEKVKECDEVGIRLRRCCRCF